MLYLRTHEHLSLWTERKKMLVLLCNKNKRVKCPLLSLVRGQAETNYVDGKSWSHLILQEMITNQVVSDTTFTRMILARLKINYSTIHTPPPSRSPNRKTQTVRRWLFSWNHGTEPEEILCDIYHWFWLQTTLARVKRNNERSLAATQSPALKHAHTGTLLPLNVSHGQQQALGGEE